MQERHRIATYSLTRMTYPRLGGVIWLRMEDRLLARLEFLASDVPANLVVRPDGVINVSYPLSAYADVVDMLRNEDPVYLTFSRGTGYAYLDTGHEPVGEGEANA